MNLKQSGFNSSCLSVPALARTVQASLCRGRSASAAERTEETGPGMLQRTHTYTFSNTPFFLSLSPATLFSPHLLVSLPDFKALTDTDQPCQGLVFQGDFGSSVWVCLVLKLLQGFIQVVCCHWVWSERMWFVVVVLCLTWSHVSNLKITKKLNLLFLVKMVEWSKNTKNITKLMPLPRYLHLNPLKWCWYYNGWMTPGGKGITYLRQLELH